MQTGRTELEPRGLLEPRRQKLRAGKSNGVRFQRTEMRESRATLLKIEEENKQTKNNTALSVNIDEETA